MKAPCHHCTERRQLCHATCAHYKAYAAEREAEREERLRQFGTNRFTNNRIDKIMRDLHRKKKQ